MRKGNRKSLLKWLVLRLNQKGLPHPLLSWFTADLPGVLLSEAPILKSSYPRLHPLKRVSSGYKGWYTLPNLPFYIPQQNLILPQISLFSSYPEDLTILFVKISRFISLQTHVSVTQVVLSNTSLNKTIPHSARGKIPFPPASLMPLYLYLSLNSDLGLISSILLLVVFGHLAWTFTYTTLGEIPEADNQKLAHHKQSPERVSNQSLDNTSHF